MFKEKKDEGSPVAIGSDHGGWELKEHIKKILLRDDLRVKDFGPYVPDSCDYPVIGAQLARSISEGLIEKGILICGTGIGMSIVANKYPGVRAALCHDIYTARMSREHNNSNILALGGRILGKGLAEEIVKTWLSTTFDDPDGRHRKRLEQIEALERGRDKG